MHGTVIKMNLNNSLTKSWEMPDRLVINFTADTLRSTFPDLVLIEFHLFGLLKQNSTGKSLQQTRTWSKLSPPVNRDLTHISSTTGYRRLCYGGEKMLKHRWWLQEIWCVPSAIQVLRCNKVSRNGVFITFNYLSIKFFPPTFASEWRLS